MRIYTGIIILCYLLIVACAQVRLGDTEADLLLEDFLSGHHPSRLKSLTATPVKETISYDRNNQSLIADLYRPAINARAAVLLVPGLTKDGKNDLRMINLAQSLARSGFLVLVPNIPSFQAYTIQIESISQLQSAFRSLQHATQNDGIQNHGIAAISFASGPALIAALDKQMRQEVDFIITVGAYYDIRKLIGYYSTGYLETNQQNKQVSQHNERLKWLFALNFIHLLKHAEDRQSLNHHADTVINNRRLIHKSLPELKGEDSQRLISLLNNTDPSRVNALVQQLPEIMQDYISSLNPADHDLGQLTARVLLVHGLYDEVIPSRESRMLFQQFKQEQASLWLIKGLGHVDFDLKVPDLDQIRGAIDTILSFREPALAL